MEKKVSFYLESEQEKEDRFKNTRIYDLSNKKIDKHLTSTESYETWYYFYAYHFKHVLTNKQ